MHHVELRSRIKVEVFLPGVSFFLSCLTSLQHVQCLLGMDLPDILTLNSLVAVVNSFKHQDPLLRKRRKSVSKMQMLKAFVIANSG